MYLDYLVKYKNRGFIDALWVTKKDIKHLQGTSISEGTITCDGGSYFHTKGV